MAETETQEEMKRRLKLWKFLQAVIDFKRGNMSLEEATQAMSYWSDGIDPDICKVLLRDMKKENIVQLSKARPELSGPTFTD